MPLFNGKIKVIIGKPNQDGILVDDLYIRFSCQKNKSSVDANSCSIDIYNLNEDRRNAINEKEDILILEAGYAEEYGAERIFIGDITSVTHRYDVNNIITTIDVKDGYNFITKDKRAVSFASASVKQMLNSILEDVNLKSNLALINFSDFKFNYGYSYAGSTKMLLDNLTSFVGINWSVQNNEIFFDKNEFLDYQVAIILNKYTGMTGSPERIKTKKTETNDDKNINGWQVSSLLLPHALPGGNVLLSSRITGDNKRMKIINVQHTGDNIDGNFQTDLEVRAL